MADDLNGVAAAIAAIFGVVFGSFLNVCIYRVPRDLSVVAPRSFCPECGEKISWRDNLPIVSFLLLKGRCRRCGQEIGYRYPLVEFITATAFAAVVFRYGFSLASAKWLVFESLMVVLFWTDLEERLLPDEFTLGGAFLGAIFAFFVSVPGVLGDVFLLDHGAIVRSLANMAAGGLLMALPIWLLGTIYAIFRKREGLGFGDVKLLLLLGIFLGPESGFLSLLFAAVGGALLGLAQILIHRKDARTYELPFGSFLCATGFFFPLLSRMGTSLSGG